jgi:hypothetical protein
VARLHNFANSFVIMRFSLFLVSGMDTIRLLRKVVTSLLPPQPLSAQDLVVDHNHLLIDTGNKSDAAHVALIEVLGKCFYTRNLNVCFTHSH